MSVLIKIASQGLNRIMTLNMHFLLAYFAINKPTNNLPTLSASNRNPFLM